MKHKHCCWAQHVPAAPNLELDVISGNCRHTNKLKATFQHVILGAAPCPKLLPVCTIAGVCIRYAEASRTANMIMLLNMA